MNQIRLLFPNEDTNIRGIKDKILLGRQDVSTTPENIYSNHSSLNSLEVIGLLAEEADGNAQENEEEAQDNHHTTESSASGTLSRLELCEIVVLKVDDIVILALGRLRFSSVFCDLFKLQFCLELVHYLLLDWVDGGHDVPVNVLGAWRGGDGASVDPSVVGVDEGKEVAVKDPVDWCGSISIRDCVEVDVFEEVLDDFLLGPGQFGVVVVDGEHDSDSGGHVPVRGVVLPGQMDCVHFEVVQLAIDGMLGLGVEMELKTVELLWSSVDLFGDVGNEGHWASNRTLKINLDGVAVEFGLSLIRVLVDLGELIGRTIVNFIISLFPSFFVLFADEVNWGLIHSRAAKVTIHSEGRPVLAKVVIVVLRSMCDAHGS